MQAVSDNWINVFERDTEQTAHMTVEIGDYLIDAGADGRLDAIRLNMTGDSFIGGFNMMAYEIDVFIMGIEELVSDWHGKKVIIKTGYTGTEMISSGDFTIDEDGIEIDENGTTATIYAVDNTYKFDKIIEPLTFPATGKQLVDEICQKVGVERNLIKDLYFDNKTFEFINVNKGQNISYRQIIAHYCQINGAMANINRSGQLELFTILDRPKTNVKVTKNDYVTVKVQPKVGPINSLKISRTDTTGDEDFDSITISDQASIDEFGITQLKISNNVFIDMFPEDTIKEVFEAIKGHEYHPISVGDWFPHFELDQGDLITVVDIEGNEFVIPFMSYSYEYGGGINGKLETVQIPDTLPEYTLEGLNQKFQYTALKVDRVANQINAIAQTQEQMNETLSEQVGKWSLTDSKIEQEIIDRKQQGDQIIDETSSKLQQTSDRFELEFTRIDGTVDEVTGDLNSMKTTYQLTADGALIGKNNEPFQLSISNRQIGFMESGSVVAYINGQKMYIESLEILQSIMLGYHQIEKYDGAERGTLIRMIGG